MPRTVPTTARPLALLPSPTQVKGRWGLDCTAFYDENEAAVACRQLGFDTGAVGDGGEGEFIEGGFLVSGVDCKDPDATSLNSCTYNYDLGGCFSEDGYGYNCMYGCSGGHGGGYAVWLDCKRK